MRPHQRVIVSAMLTGILAACSSASSPSSPGSDSGTPSHHDGGAPHQRDASTHTDSRPVLSDAPSPSRDSSPLDAVSSHDSGARDAGTREAGIDSAAPDNGWVLTWSDEFNEPNGSVPDPTKWTYTSISGAVSGPGWGVENDTPSAVTIENGNLVFTATQDEDAGGKVYSGAIDSMGKFEQTYGRFEARIKVATGAGAWSAFWMLGDNGTPWPTCGEIDVVEVVQSSPHDAYGTLHSGNTSNATENTSTGASYMVPSGNMSDDYHLYAVEWAPDAIKFYVDDNLYATQTNDNLTAGEVWAFNHPFYVIVNLEVGGSWAGAPNASSFPMTMLVDYVRVYKAAM
jgi:beta-glucanase (GH16 family)